MQLLYTGTEIGIITGIFGFSAIFIRLFTDTGVRKFGKKKCLYFGLFCSFLATFSYDIFTKCERKAPKFIYGDISSLKNNDSISLFFIVLYF